MVLFSLQYFIMESSVCVALAERTHVLTCSKAIASRQIIQ